jgi:hypothetical protein
MVALPAHDGLLIYTIDDKSNVTIVTDILFDQDRRRSDGRWAARGRK